MLTGLQYGGEVLRDIMAAVHKTKNDTAELAIVQQELHALHAA